MGNLDAWSQSHIRLKQTNKQTETTAKLQKQPIELKFSQVCYFMHMLIYKLRIEDWSLTMYPVSLQSHITNNLPHWKTWPVPYTSHISSWFPHFSSYLRDCQPQGVKRRRLHGKLDCLLRPCLNTVLKLVHMTPLAVWRMVVVHQMPSLTCKKVVSFLKVSRQNPQLG